MLHARSLPLASLLLLALPAIAPGQGSPRGPLRPNERTITVRFKNGVSTENHPIYLGLGSATLLKMPRAIRPNGVVINSPEGHLTWSPHGDDTIVMVGRLPINEKHVPMTIMTTDGNIFTFQLKTGLEEYDAKVKVEVASKEGRRQVGPRDPLMEILLWEGPELAHCADEVKRPPHRVEPPVPLSTPQVQLVTRWGGILYLLVWRQRTDRSEPWKVVTAELEGAAGDRPKVLDVQHREDGWNDINVILAELPKGASAGYTLRSVQLSTRNMTAALLKEPVVFP
jgi:hypothetical protein